MTTISAYKWLRLVFVRLEKSTLYFLFHVQTIVIHWLQQVDSIGQLWKQVYTHA